MTTFTNNFRIPHLDQNIAQPEIPENVAKDIMDSITGSIKVIETIDTNNITVAHVDTAYGTTDYQNFMFKVKDTGAFLTGGISVIFPDYARTYVFINDTDYGITFKTASGSGITLLAGTNAYGYSDGTNIIRMDFNTIAPSTYIALPDTQLDFLAGPGFASVINATSDGLDWYDMAEKVDSLGGLLTNALIHMKNYSFFENVESGSGATHDIDLSNGNYAVYSASANTTFTFTTTHNATEFKLLIINTGAFTMTLPTVMWSGGVAPTLTQSGTDLLTFVKINENWVGSAILNIS